MRRCPAPDDALRGLIEDLTGQVTEAISRQDWFFRWGRHYLPSLERAHRLQLCTNFKDAGLQHYGGELFRMEQERADTTFCSLPAPEPSMLSYRGGGMGRSVPTRPVSMASFHCRGNPCFAGECMVKLASPGTFTRVDALRQGDRVASPTSILEYPDEVGGLEVLCVVKTLCGPTAPLVRMGQKMRLRITPWHPVRPGPELSWMFPCQVGP